MAARRYHATQGAESRLAPAICRSQTALPGLGLGLGVAEGRSGGHHGDDLRIAPALYDPVGAAKPDLAAALEPTEAGARDGHLRSRKRVGRE